MKDMASLLEKQHNLLKLIMQKMEITSEADEYDGPVNIRGRMWPSLSQAKPKRVSRWVPLMKAIEYKRKWRWRDKYNLSYNFTSTVWIVDIVTVILPCAPNLTALQ